MQRYTFNDFNRDYPNDAACLEWLREYLYPDGIHCKKCDRVTKHHRVASRQSYSCDNCGHHVHPTAGTIFHKSTTPLRLWFYAIYLMAQTRCGISAKQIERETGVTYKTAWRMFKQIRSLLAEDDSEPIGGESAAPVELDESYFGGRPRHHIASRSVRAKSSLANKTTVFGMVQRRGRVRATVVPDSKRITLMPIVAARVLPRTMVYTDEFKSYSRLPQMGYAHRRVHHAAKVYVDGDVHTNTIEGFWSLVKRGIDGVYHAVSAKYLQTYLNEYSFRYNHRKDEIPMFKQFLGQIAIAR
jgi:transposase